MIETNKTKSVSFNEAEISTTQYIESIPKEIHAKIWYAKSRFTANKQRERMMRCCIKLKPNADNWDAQGILSKEDMARKRIAKDKSIAAVLDEEEHQIIQFLKENNYTTTDFEVEIDQEGIAKAYLPHSQLALSRAQLRALRLEKHLKKINSQDSSLSSRRKSSSHSKRHRSPRLQAPSRAKAMLKLQPSCRELFKHELHAVDVAPPMLERRISATAAA